MSVQRKFLISVFTFFIGILFVFVILLMIHVKKTDSIIFVDDMTCFYKEKVYVDRFIREIDGELLDKYLVDTSSLGKKMLEVQFRNRYGFVERKRFEIEVKDKVAPVIIVDNPYTVYEGEVTDLLSTIFCADDYDDGIQCSISGDYDLNKIGQYPLKIEAIDKSGNVTRKNFVLNVEKNIENIQPVTSVAFKEIYQKYKTTDTEIGVDISMVQGDIDYNSLVNNGVSFVMLRVGGQDGVGSDVGADSKFFDNVKNALDHHLKVGVYFQSYAKNVNEAKRQARWVVQNIRDYDISLPVAFVWNQKGRYSNLGIGFRSLNRIASSFLSEIERYGYRGMIYSNKLYFGNVWDVDVYDTWVAYDTDSFNYDKDYLMWQVCDNGKIDGIDGTFGIHILKTK